MYFKTVAYVLTAIGAINWGLVGVADFNLVAYLLGSVPAIEKTIYVVVGLSGAYCLFKCLGGCSKSCKK